MALRNPVYWDGSSIVSMTEAQLTKIRQRCVYLFGSDSRPVNLSYTAGNAGNLTRMLDKRDIAGAESSNARSFANNTASLEAVTDGGASTTYDYINMTETDGSPSDPSDTNNRAFPLYRDGTSGFRAMTKDDMYDTFINHAIDLLIDGNDRDGTYRISTQASTLANHTRVNANPVFVDQRFDISIHNNADSSLEILPLDSADLPVTITSYYLWRTNQGTAFSGSDIDIVLPLQLDSNEDLTTYSSSNFDTLLQNLLFYSAASRTNYRIRYNIEGSGVDAQSISDNVNTPKQRGDAMLDTTLDGSVRIDDQDADTYRSRNLPAGSAETETTYTLKIYRK